ncbi:MAG: hypothetical protein QOE83_93 [Actinomycetota bacterium]|nr:hypothetical protein [Actinomycetota bacterium]
MVQEEQPADPDGGSGERGQDVGCPPRNPWTQGERGENQDRCGRHDDHDARSGVHALDYRPWR